jgi:hypothetical protein
MGVSAPPAVCAMLSTNLPSSHCFLIDGTKSRDWSETRAQLVWLSLKKKKKNASCSEIKGGQNMGEDTEMAGGREEDGSGNQRVHLLRVSCTEKIWCSWGC